MFPRIALLASVLASVLAVAGCGYQLRGAVSLPPGLDAIHVDGPPGIGAALVQALEGGGARIASTRDSTSALLQLSDERFNRRVLSVDPDTGKEREFELAYRVTFRLTGGDGAELVRTQTVSLLRDYVFDSSALLGTSREQGIIRAEMLRDAAGQVVRRIAASLGD